MSPSSNGAWQTAPQALPSDSLSTLTYRSRSVLPMSELELHRLLSAAQTRNHSEGVTGVMVYDRGWIFQQLEGPAHGMARIWDSVQRDRRHTAIEVLGNAATRQRHFAEWDLKLSIHGAGAGQAQGDAADAPSDLIGRLCRGEQTAHQLPAWEHLLAPEAEAASTATMDRARLLNLIEAVVIPKLIAALPLVGAALPAAHPQATALARLLIAADPAAAFALVGALHAADGSLATLATRLLEPAARGLGNLWRTDDCSELEVTRGLMRLQGFIRELSLSPGFAPLAPLHPPVVLVVPQPGEDHMLGAALDAELLWRAGWNPQVDFPASSGALDALVSSTWIDALDVSLSTSFRREHRLPQLSETIAHARLASLNPGLVVVVSGRVFSEAGEAQAAALTGREVGADASFGSAAQAEPMILRALTHARTAAAGRR